MPKSDLHNAKGGVKISLLVVVIFAGGVWYGAEHGWFNEVGSDYTLDVIAQQRQEEEQKIRTHTSEKIAAAEYSEVFKNDKYKFSLFYPAGLTAVNFQDGNGETFLFQDSSAKVGFQIYVTPVEDASIQVITKELILKDIPDMQISDDQPVLLGENGKGLAFIETTGGEKRRQVWFAVGGYLYQITAPIESDGLLQKTLNTMKFN